MATFYLDFDGGNDASDGTTFANRWKTISSGATAARIAPGDTIRMMASPDPTSLGQTASWTDGSATVTLTSAVTATLHDGETAWTAAANVTCSTSTSNYRTGTKAATIAPATAFTTGKMAYAALGASTDVSGYQQISCWFRSTGVPSAGTFELKLCSDTTGDTPVDTFSLPAIDSASTWHVVTIDKGSALGSAIQSIALYATVDPGTQTVSFDQILACKAASSADSLTLSSLIGKQSDGSDGWWPILSIAGTAVTLDRSLTGNAPTSMPYRGTTESVTTYKREPIILSGQSLNVVQDSGTDGSPITFSGGWNRTDMSTQTGETWVAYRLVSTAFQYAQVMLNGEDFVRVDKLFACRGYGLRLGPTFALAATAGSVGAVASYYGIDFANVLGVTVDELKQAIGCNYGLRCNEASSVTVNGISRLHGNVSGISLSPGSHDCIFNGASGATARGNTFGIELDTGSWGTKVRNIAFSNSVTADLDVNGASSDTARLDLFNCALNSTSVLSSTNGYVYSARHQQTADSHKIYWYNGSGTIQSATDQRHTASGIAWKFNPLSTTVVNSVAPLRLSVVKLACAASTQRTVSIWMRRSNTGLSMRLRVPGGQIAGVASDVTASITAAADTWEQVSLNFTPTEAGVVEVFAEAWGGTTYSGWVDDLARS